MKKTLDQKKKIWKKAKRRAYCEKRRIENLKEAQRLFDRRGFQQRSWSTGDPIVFHDENGLTTSTRTKRYSDSL